MAHDLVHPPKARGGERIAVLSPSFAAAGAFPAVHEQAMRRLTEVTGLVPVEYPTRKVGAAAQPLTSTPPSPTRRSIMAAATARSPAAADDESGNLAGRRLASGRPSRAGTAVIFQGAAGWLAGRGGEPRRSDT